MTTDRLIRLTTALAVLTVAGVAAVMSYQHAYEFVTTHGETGVTAPLLPFTTDGQGLSRVSTGTAPKYPCLLRCETATKELNRANRASGAAADAGRADLRSSMVALDASRRNQAVPRLALWSLGAGIVGTVGANLAHGLGHGPVGALVSAWPALALVGSFELLMLLIRKHHQADAGDAISHVAPGLAQSEPSMAQPALPLEEMVRDLHVAGHSQRSIARDLSIGRRRVKQIIDIQAT